MSALLEVEGLDVAYGPTQILFGVSLTVPADSLVCIMGRNGVGKTTLLDALMGSLKPRAGTIRFDGQDISRWPPHRRARAGMGYVPQGHDCFASLTVMENLQVMLESLGGRGSRLDDVLDVFPRLRPLLPRRAGFLSGGQQQQLAIARTLIGRPRLLILDEPTEGIQPSVILEIEDAIAQLHRDHGLTILLVEQYVEFAVRLADRYVVLDAGELVAAGDTSDLDQNSLARLVAF